MNTCFFIGHSSAPEVLREIIFEEVMQCIKLGVNNFVVGQYGSFDAMAAGAVKRAKKLHEGIQLLLLLPYHPAERPISLPDGFDGTLYPFEKAVPNRIAIAKANQTMIDSSEFLICYVKYPGNSRKILEYAEKKRTHIKIINLAK